MAGKKRGKRRPHRRRGGAGTRGKAPPQESRPQQGQTNADREASITRSMAATGRQLASPASVPAGAERKLATAPADTPARQGGLGRQNTGPMRLPTVLLPGRWFFAMGRPVAGWVCYALQVSLVGWLPAALWAVSAERRVAQKRRGLAARLRPL